MSVLPALGMTILYHKWWLSPFRCPHFDPFRRHFDKREFGADIAKWVGAVSYSSKIKDPVKKYQEMLVRTRAAGKISVVVKAADLHANSLYIRLVPDTKKQRLFLGKIEYFLGIARAFKKEPVIQRLNDRYRAEFSRIEKNK